MEKLVQKLKGYLNKDKKTSNLILFIILLVILLISMNYIFNSEKKNSTKETSSVQTSSSTTQDFDYSTDMEKRLSNILSQIEGIEEASVMLTYSTTEKIYPVYDIKENVDIDQDSDKKSTSTTTEKSVAYKETDEGKVPIVESKEEATASGAIIAIEGTVDTNTLLKIKDAVAAITSIPIYKIQVFTK